MLKGNCRYLFVTIKSNWATTTRYMKHLQAERVRDSVLPILATSIAGTTAIASDSDTEAAAGQSESSGTPVASAGQQQASNPQPMGMLEEMIVTARKRSEPLQDAPIAVQAMSYDSLVENRVETFEDYVLHLPNVKAGGRGPGQNEIYIRGLAVDAINISVAEAQGSAPNVALYLDEQPVTAGGRNLDVFVSDLARVEVLPGPQGTLYGASSQAGTVRLISNKPVQNETSASFNATASITSDGDPSSSAEAIINIPISQRIAARAVVFSSRMGGYIDNIPSSLIPDTSKNPSLPSAQGIMYVPEGGDPMSHQFADGTYAVPGKRYPVEYTAFHNTNLVEENFNDSAYSGFRVGLAYDVNENWNVLVQHHQQSVIVDGVFDFDKELGELEVARYGPDTLDDTFGQTSWTVQGRLERLDLVYTGAYLGRRVNQKYDYSEYVNVGGFIPSYLCEYNTPGYHGGGGVSYTWDPTLSGRSDVIECVSGQGYVAIDNENSRWTHEFRVTTDITDRVSLTGGIFFQDRLTQHVGDFNYGDPRWPALDVSGISLGTANKPETRTHTTQFSNDITRPELEQAVFGEVSVSVLDNLALTVGARQYSIEVGFEGYSAFRYGTRPLPNLVGMPGVNVNNRNFGGRDYQSGLGDQQPMEIDDLITKVGFGWDVTEDLLIFGAISEGYRPPGFNRVGATGGNRCEDGSAAARSNDGPGGFPDYCIPTIFVSDTTTNYEIGWKVIALERQLRLNGALYRINWDNIQVSHFDSQNISILTIVDNGGDAELTGLEMDGSFHPNANLSIHGGASFNSTELVRVNPAFDFVVADVGSELPLTPNVQFSLRGRYEWEAMNGNAFVQVGANYAGESYNSLVDVPVTDPRQRQEPWTIIDASIGLQAIEGWNFEVYLDNVLDTRAELHINRQDFRERVTTNRPRSLGMRIGMSF